MDDQDRYTRITLRIPRDLHAALSKEADKTSKSLNAEIVARLEGSFEASPADTQRVQYLEQTNQQLTRALTAMTSHLAALENTARSEKKFDSLFRHNLANIRTDFGLLVDDLQETLGGDSTQYIELEEMQRRLELLDDLLDDAPQPEDPQQRLFT